MALPIIKLTAGGQNLCEIKPLAPISTMSYIAFGHTQLHTLLLGMAISFWTSYFQTPRTEERQPLPPIGVLSNLLYTSHTRQRATPCMCDDICRIPRQEHYNIHQLRREYDDDTYNYRFHYNLKRACLLMGK